MNGTMPDHTARQPFDIKKHPTARSGFLCLETADGGGVRGQKGRSEGEKAGMAARVRVGSSLRRGGATERGGKEV